MKRFWIYPCFTAAAVTLSSCGAGDKAPAAKIESIQDLFGGTDQAKFDRRQLILQEKIAKCMHAEGFEYTAFVQKSPQVGEIPKRGQEVAFKRKYAYNFTTILEHPKTNQPVADTDPNSKRIDKMSEDERNAYSRALYGSGQGQSSEPTGCEAEAYKVLGDAWKPLEAKFVALQKTIETDSDIAKLNAKFVSCMRKAGYAISREQDLYEKLLNPNYQKVSDGLPQNASTAEVAPSGPPPATPTIPRKKIEEFKTLEFEIANADADCRPQGDVNKVFEITQKHEKAFNDENKALLEKFKTAQG